MCHFLPSLLRYGPKATACAGAQSNGRNVYLLQRLPVMVVSRQTLIMLTILCSAQIGMQARQTLDRNPPHATSTLSSTASFSILRRPTSGFDSSSATISSTGRPLIPPDLLIRSTAICTPTSAVLPPAAAPPDKGCKLPMRNALVCAKACRHTVGATTTEPS